LERWIERAPGAFGAARAFPIRERCLLGTSDPLKRRSQATRFLEVVIGVIRRSARRVGGLAPLGTLGGALGDPGAPSRSRRPLGTGAKGNVAFRGVSTSREVVPPSTFRRNPQVARVLHRSSFLCHSARNSGEERRRPIRPPVVNRSARRGPPNVPVSGWRGSGVTLPPAGPRRPPPACPRPRWSRRCERGLRWR
jgi:hypothetical protein